MTKERKNPVKKAFLIILASILLLASACAEEVAFPVLEWETDGKNHWQIDASGAVINQGFHATDDSWRCAICNSEILEWEEDIDVTDFDAYGNAVRYTNYSKDGEVNQQNVYVLTYNENGMIEKRKEYIDGVLVCEDVYTANAEGDQLPVSSTVWFDDGTVSVNQWTVKSSANLHRWKTKYTEFGTTNAKIRPALLPVKPSIAKPTNMATRPVP